MFVKSIREIEYDIIARCSSNKRIKSIAETNFPDFLLQEFDIVAPGTAQISTYNQDCFSMIQITEVVSQGGSEETLTIKLPNFSSSDNMVYEPIIDNINSALIRAGECQSTDNVTNCTVSYCKDKLM